MNAPAVVVGVAQEMHDQRKRNACYAAQLCLQAVQRLFNIAGGRALYLYSPLQRMFRDCFAAADYGRHALGAPKAGAH